MMNLLLPELVKHTSVIDKRTSKGKVHLLQQIADSGVSLRSGDGNNDSAN